MTRRTHTQLLLGEIVLFGLAMPDPGELMDPELQRIDKLLDDEVLLDAVVERLQKRSKNSRTKGRPSTPAEVVLRMLVLKHLRNWSYKRLQWEVTGNVAYRQFCRIGAEKVPDEKTLVRLGKLLGESVLRTLCDRLVQVAVERKGRRCQGGDAGAVSQTPEGNCTVVQTVGAGHRDCNLAARQPAPESSSTGRTCRASATNLRAARQASRQPDPCARGARRDQQRGQAHQHL